VRQFPRLKRAILAGGSLVFVFAAVLTPTGTAYAGPPLEATSYQGTTAHGRYTVDMNTGGTYGGYTPPDEVGIVLTTHPQPGTGCAAKGYAFDSTTLAANGSFSTTAYFSDASPQLTFTVSGTFVSASSVHGTVSGNYGCGTDSFTINLHPAPLISTSPCALLADVHTVRVIGGGLGGYYGGDNSTFTTQGGRCDVEFGRDASDLSFFVASSPAGLGSALLAQDGGSYQHQKPLTGLGTGATLYWNNHYTPPIVRGKSVPSKPTSSVEYFEVNFRRSNVWASLSRATFGGCECFSPAGFAVQVRHIVALAAALRPLLH
jgi:hypothetical protein